MVRTEAREDLNFVMYVGIAYDLLPDDLPFSVTNRWSASRTTIPLQIEKYHLTQQWQEWWNQLTNYRYYDSQSIGCPNEWFQPPDSVGLPPELSEVCKNVWIDFIGWWQMPAGGGRAMHYWETSFDFGKYVREYEQQQGRQLRAFQFYVELVYAGLDEILEIDENHVVMPLLRKTDFEKWWKGKLQEIF